MQFISHLGRTIQILKHLLISFHFHLFLLQLIFQVSVLTVESNSETEAKPQSQKSLRFRAKMHAYAAHYEKPQEECYARSEWKHEELLKERNAQWDLDKTVIIN